MTEQEFDGLVSRPLEREVHERQLELMSEGMSRQEARRQAAQELDYSTLELRVLATDSDWQEGTNTGRFSWSGPVEWVPVGKGKVLRMRRDMQGILRPAD